MVTLTLKVTTWNKESTEIKHGNNAHSFEEKKTSHFNTYVSCLSECRHLPQNLEEAYLSCQLQPRREVP